MQPAILALLGAASFVLLSPAREFTSPEATMTRVSIREADMKHTSRRLAIAAFVLCIAGVRAAHAQKSNTSISNALDRAPALTSHRSQPYGAPAMTPYQSRLYHATSMTPHRTQLYRALSTTPHRTLHCTDAIRLQERRSPGFVRFLGGLLFGTATMVGLSAATWNDPDAIPAAGVFTAYVLGTSAGTALATRIWERPRWGIMLGAAIGATPLLAAMATRDDSITNTLLLIALFGAPIGAAIGQR